jgi:hypothetical protein
LLLPTYQNQKQIISIPFREKDVDKKNVLG